MKSILFFSLLFCFQNSLAQNIEDEALIKTQSLLKNASERSVEIIKSPDAVNADRNAEVTALGNPAFKQEMYNISSDLLPWLVGLTQGDVSKMSDLLLEAQKNPQAFYERFPAAEKEKIKALSEAIESNRNKNKAP
jgi:hypothetical protein